MYLRVTKGRCLTVLDANDAMKGIVWRYLTVLDEEAATDVDRCS
jgi:hypothetical protein